MKYLFTSLLAICSTVSSLFAQSAKSVYFEIGGPGLASFNFDFRLSGKEGGIGGRVGIGGFSIGNTSLVTIPVGFNYLLGKNQRNYFEMGLGYTP